MTIFVPSVGGGTPAGVAGVYDYNSLKQAVQDWFARSDLGGWIDYFIQMAEADIYRDILTNNQGRGVRQMETSFSGTTDANGVVPLPFGYIALKIALVELDGRATELQRVTPEFIYTQYPCRAPDDIPAFISRDGQNFVFGPYPDADYAISGTYWQRSAQLTVSNTVTWMTDSIPTILLAACNRWAARFNKDQESLGMWDTVYSTQLNSFLQADRAEELSGSSLAMVAA
jgi:hypothetical protein